MYGHGDALVKRRQNKAVIGIKGLELKSKSNHHLNIPLLICPVKLIMVMLRTGGVENSTWPHMEQHTHTHLF